MSQRQRRRYADGNEDHHLAYDAEIINLLIKETVYRPVSPTVHGHLAKYSTIDYNPNQWNTVN